MSDESGKPASAIEHRIGQIDVRDRVEHREALGFEEPGLELLIERSGRDEGRELFDRPQQLVDGMCILAILANAVAVPQLLQAIVDL